MGKIRSNFGRPCAKFNPLARRQFRLGVWVAPPAAPFPHNTGHSGQQVQRNRFGAMKSEPNVDFESILVLSILRISRRFVLLYYRRLLNYCKSLSVRIMALELTSSSLLEWSLFVMSGTKGNPTKFRALKSLTTHSKDQIVLGKRFNNCELLNSSWTDRRHCKVKTCRLE